MQIFRTILLIQTFLGTIFAQNSGLTRSFQRQLTPYLSYAKPFTALESQSAYTTLCQLFSESDKALKSPILGTSDQVAVTDECFEDMNLFSGGVNSPKDNLSFYFNHLPDTPTLFGFAAFDRLLTTPIFDIQVLKQRQHFIQTLLAKPELFAQIKKHLEDIKKYQTDFLYFYQTSTSNPISLLNRSFNMFWQDMKDMPYSLAPQMWEKCNTIHKFLLFGYPLAAWQSIKTMMEQGKNVSRVLGECKEHWSDAFVGHASSRFPLKLNKFIYNLWGWDDLAKSWQSNPGDNWLDRTTWSWKMFASVTTLSTLPIFFLITFWQLPQKSRESWVKYGHDYPIAFYSSFKRIAGFSRFLKATLSLESCLKKAGLSLQMTKYLTQFSREYTAKPSRKKHVARLAHLRTLVDHRLFSKAPNFADAKKFLFAHHGRVLHTYREIWLHTGFEDAGQNPASDYDVLAGIKKHRFNIAKQYQGICHNNDLLLLAAQAIGELDAYCTMAKLFSYLQASSTNHHGLKFNFVHFEEKSQEIPHLVLNGVWNPIIKPLTKIGELVDNDVALGVGETSGNMLISGPNTGGKSTFMRSVMASVILGQTFGVAPASFAQFTPFVYLDCYQKDGEDPTAGLSSYHAQVLKAKDMVNCLDVFCKERNQPAFILADELFKGTEQNKAAAVGIGLAQLLSQNYPECLNIWSSHAKGMTLVEKATNGKFANYHIEALKQPDKSYIYTRKIKPGMSHVSTSSEIVGRVFDAQFREQVEEIERLLD